MHHSMDDTVADFNHEYLRPSINLTPDLFCVQVCRDGLTILSPTEHARENNVTRRHAFTLIENLSVPGDLVLDLTGLCKPDRSELAQSLRPLLERKTGRLALIIPATEGFAEDLELYRLIPHYNAAVVESVGDALRALGRTASPEDRVDTFLLREDLREQYRRNAAALDGYFGSQPALPQRAPVDAVWVDLQERSACIKLLHQFARRIDCESPAYQELRKALDALKAERPARQVVVDLSADSGGLGGVWIDDQCVQLLIFAARTLKRNGGSLRLVRVPNELRESLGIKRLSGLFGMEGD